MTTEVRGAAAEAALPVELERPDIWEYYLRFEGGQIPCESLTRFLLLVYSPSTVRVVPEAVSTARAEATLYVEGPMCEEFGPLFAKYRLERGELVSCLEPEERRELSKVLKRLLGEKAKNTLMFSALGLPKTW